MLQYSWNDCEVLSMSFGARERLPHVRYLAILMDHSESGLEVRDRLGMQVTDLTILRSQLCLVPTRVLRAARRPQLPYTWGIMPKRDIVKS